MTSGLGTSSTTWVSECTLRRRRGKGRWQSTAAACRGYCFTQPPLAFQVKLHSCHGICHHCGYALWRQARLVPLRLSISPPHDAMHAYCDVVHCRPVWHCACGATAHPCRCVDCPKPIAPGGRRGVKKMEGRQPHAYIYIYMGRLGLQSMLCLLERSHHACMPLLTAQMTKHLCLGVGQ